MKEFNKNLTLEPAPLPGVDPDDDADVDGIVAELLDAEHTGP